MLIMKTQCERCRSELGADAEATICSFECTFCPSCAAQLSSVCPNCSGELVARPRRDPSAGLASGIGGRLRVEAANLTANRQMPVITVERLIPAPARVLFDLLAAPARHAELDGSGTLLGHPQGPDRLYLGAKFGMGMAQQGVKYTSTNEVVEFVDNRVIAWQTFGALRGYKFVGGQKWRYELEPQEDGATLVKASYDWSEAKAGRFTVEAMGFPEKSRTALTATLRRLEAIAKS